MIKEKYNYIVTALKITLIYLLLGIFLVLFLVSSQKETLSNFILGISFILITSVLFYFLINYFLKKDIPAPVVTEINNDNNRQKYESEQKARVYSEQINTAKSQFLSNMSQEIRTPMSGIIGMTELMMLTDLTKEQKEYLDVINYSSSTLLAVINDILDFSRIESGQLKLESVKFSIIELINKTSKVLDFEAKRKNIVLKVNIDPKINYNIYGDPLRINQILINLTQNAIKYTNVGAVSLSVSEFKSVNDNASLLFSVMDCGIGFNSDTIQKLFGALGNSGKVTLDKNFHYSGVGFGLPIIKHLVAFMNGEMFVKTNVNEGTGINIIIPFKLHIKDNVNASENSTPVETKVETYNNDHHSNDKIHILVAEDNIVNQRVLKELLEKKNHEVTIVENGLKIFDVLENTKPDIILMDIEMPVMDGFEATSLIRDNEKGTGRHIPIIGITAYAVNEDKEKCLAAGMDNYLSKPFVNEDFYKMIDSYIFGIKTSKVL